MARLDGRTQKSARTQRSGKTNALINLISHQPDIN